MIRPARGEDLPALNRIEHGSTAAFDAPIRAHAATFPPLPPEAFAAAVAAGACWVADQDGAPVGFIACGLLDATPFVEELSVLPAHHRRGFGTALLACAIGWAAPAGALTLTTFRDVAFNAPWYARQGFVAFAPGPDRSELAARLVAERRHWDRVAARVAMIRGALPHTPQGLCP